MAKDQIITIKGAIKQIKEAPPKSGSAKSTPKTAPKVKK